MKSEHIDQITESVVAQLPELIGDLRPHILEAASAVLEECSEQENAKPTLTISLAIKINLAKDPVSYNMKAGVSVKRTAECDEVQLDDPNQPKLALV
jgi:hypothetical protein